MSIKQAIYILVFFTIYITTYSRTQTIKYFKYSLRVDSLENSFIAKKEKDYNLALLISELYKPISKIKTLYFLNKSYELALAEESSYKVNKSLLRILDFYHETNHHEKEESILKELLNYLLFKNNTKLKYSEETTKLHTVNNDTTLFLILLKAARFYQKTDSLKKAEYYLDIAHRSTFKHASANKSYFNQVYLSFAEQCLKEKKLKQAISYLNQVITLFDIIIDKSEIAWNLYENGSLLTKYQYTQEANQYLTKALKYFHQTNDYFGLGFTYYKLYLNTNTNKEKQIYYLKKSYYNINKDPEYNNIDLHLTVTYILAYELLEQNKLNETKDILDHFFNFHQQHGSITNIKRTIKFYTLLQNYYLKIDKPYQALKASQKIIENQDSLKYKQQLINNDELNLQCKVVDNERKNNLLNKDNSIYRLELNKERVIKYFLIGSSVIFMLVISILYFITKKDKRLNQKLEQKVQTRTFELVEKNDKLNIAYTKLKQSQKIIIEKEKLASLGTMIAGIAHEINNPSQAIKFSSQSMKLNITDLETIITHITNTLNNKNLSKKQIISKIQNITEQYDLNTILEELTSTVTDNLSAVARIEHIVKSTKRMSHKIEGVQNCNLQEIIQDIITLLKNSLKYGAQIKLSIPDDIPLFQSNPNDIGQIFINLINNSIDAIKEKGLSPFEGKISISAQFFKPLKKIKIKISDNGIGIDQELENNIFDPFFTTKSIGKGTGLGLNIVYRILQAYNGEIRYESEKGKGTTFTILIPISLSTNKS